MRIYYKTILYGYNEERCHKIGDRHSCEVIGSQSCCNDMEEAFGEDLGVDFYYRDEKRFVLETLYNIEYSNNLENIRYCPFCGEKIEFIEKKKVYLIKQIKRQTTNRTIFEEVEKLEEEQNENR